MEQLELGVEVFGRCFDHQCDVEILEVRTGVDMFEHAAACLARHPAFFHVAVEAFRDAVDPTFDAHLINVVEEHLVPVHRKHLCDTGTHLPGTDDHQSHARKIVPGTPECLGA